MKISIAMATYNGAQYLEAQLQSFIDQTRQPDELIVTDDCSTDQTETIVRAFSETAPFEVVFSCNERKLGPCGNFNEALLKSTGDLVFLSDQDDVWFAEKIAHMVSIAEQHPEALVMMHDAALTDGELNEVGLSKLGQIRSSGLPISSFVMGCCCAIRRELLGLSLPIPAGVMAHDVWLSWFADGLGVKLVDDRILQFYRRHESNASEFITSRTTKVNRLQAFPYSYINIFSKDYNKKVRLLVEQLSIFVRVINRSIVSDNEKYREKLKEMCALAESVISTQEQRIAIRERALFPRFIEAARFLARGGYDNSAGLISFFRDLVG